MTPLVTLIKCLLNIKLAHISAKISILFVLEDKIISVIIWMSRIAESMEDMKDKRQEIMVATKNGIIKSVYVE